MEILQPVINQIFLIWKEMQRVDRNRSRFHIMDKFRFCRNWIGSTRNTRKPFSAQNIFGWYGKKKCCAKSRNFDKISYKYSSQSQKKIFPEFVSKYQRVSENQNIRLISKCNCIGKKVQNKSKSKVQTNASFCWINKRILSIALYVFGCLCRCGTVNSGTHSTESSIKNDAQCKHGCKQKHV